MINRDEPVARGIAAQRFEIDVPVLAGILEKIQQTAADTPNCGNFKFARRDRLIEGVRLSASARVIALPASSTPIAMAQTPGPCPI